MRDTAAVPLGGQHEVEKGQTPAQGMNHVATVTAALPLLVQLCMADHWRGRCNAHIASSHGVERDNCAVLVRFASTKILVQTQWEAVRFDRVKHTAGSQLEVFSAAAAGAIILCGAITLRAAAD